MKGKYSRIRKMIWRKLGEGSMNTTQITEYVNSNHKNGASANALGNVLAKHPEFECVGNERIYGITGSTYIVKVWGRK